MKANTALDKMDEIEKLYPPAMRWSQLRRLLMAAAQAESQLTPVAADVAYWLCKSCGIHNHKDLEECGDCGTPRR